VAGMTIMSYDRDVRKRSNILSPNKTNTQFLICTFLAFFTNAPAS
jgi:hypothetical protein